MANEKRLICKKCDHYLVCKHAYKEREECSVYKPYTVDAVEADKYKALLEMYHELRDNFIDYYCSGTQNVAPYCLNKCKECVDKWGYCKQYSDYCKGFNPAEVILDGAKMDGDGNV